MDRDEIIEALLEGSIYSADCFLDDLIEDHPEQEEEIRAIHKELEDGDHYDDLNEDVSNAIQSKADTI